MRIHPLDTNIANQIAAGEVIERPASVIKELLENSIDAGATVIEIDVEKAGQQLIRIRDNGHGIHPDDLSLTIHPHATSKLRTLIDLNELATLGFRGEALASISSIAELSIQSQYHQHSNAFQLKANGDVLPTAHPAGTTIEVRDLFMKVPVRRKFLKSDRTEFSHIEDVVKRIALSHFEVAISLKHNDGHVLRVLPATEPAQYLQRIGKILGKKFAVEALSLDCENRDFRLWGWTLPEAVTRAHADQQFMFINGRMVKDKVLQHAVRLAYEAVYQQGQYPAYVLYFECAADSVDVNVHPTKHEVRFHQQRLVHDFVLATLRQGLQGSPAALSSVAETEQTANPYFVKEPHQRYQYNVGVVAATTFTVLTLLAERYLLASDQQQLLVVDLLQAEQQLALQMLQTKKVTSERLLIPAKVILSEEQLQTIEAQQNELEQWGFELTITGVDSLLLRQLPTFLKGADYQQLFSTLVNTAAADQAHCLSQFAVLATDLKKEQLQQRLDTVLQQTFSQDNTICRYLSSSDLAELLT